MNIQHQENAHDVKHDSVWLLVMFSRSIFLFKTFNFLITSRLLAIVKEGKAQKLC